MLTAAPYPVLIPHPRRQTLSRGAAGSILATATWFITVYSENVLVPMNCNTFFPLQVNLDSSEDITSYLSVALEREHKAFFTGHAAILNIEKVKS